MKAILFTLSLLLFGVANAQNSSLVQKDTASLQVKTYTLSNGLTVWLNEDQSQPMVWGGVVVKAGAKHSPNTGIAHYFEHIMFKGTDKIGTTDYEKEKVFLDKIADKYDELSSAEDDLKRKEIQKEINELSIQASDYAIPNEFSSLISNYGGSQLNAGTSYDFTVYFNVFSPQYFEAWSELNSERLLNPVFRLFQSELETVYEEKNMYDDQPFAKTMENMMARYFTPHPYAYPIVGSSENLKNPKLSQMKKFFEDYYVAGNMGLLLSGNFNSDSVLPILEKYFSRVKAGDAPVQEIVTLPDFKGRESAELKLSIPVMKLMMIMWRGLPNSHKDEAALAVATGLLNNANATGYFDKLMVEGKLMGAVALSQSLQEAGMLGFIVVPKIAGQSYGAAEKLVLTEIERIKNGDFSDDAFQSLKLEKQKEFEESLEDVSSRSQLMLTAFSAGKSWGEYLKEAEEIQNLTKEDVVAAAKKYFSENYIVFEKRTGSYPSGKVEKPGFAPIVPKNSDAKSEYTRMLEKEFGAIQPSVKIIDFQKEIQKVQFDNVSLFYKENPINSVFSLDLTYDVGESTMPVLNVLQSYLSLLGTDSLSFEEFRTKLQSIGASLSFFSSENTFTIEITGIDAYFDQTLEYVGNFVASVKADQRKIKQLADGVKMESKAFFESSDEIAKALVEYQLYGEKSEYLNKLSASEVKKLKAENLILSFKEAMTYACQIHYVGSASIDQVKQGLHNNFDFSSISKPAVFSYYREPLEIKEPTVFVVNMPKSKQAIITTAILTQPFQNLEDKYAALLFDAYFGGDMSSLMFQEIREFRSFAYRASSKLYYPPMNIKDKKGLYLTMMSTQNDKALEAITILDSLIRYMPVKEDKLPLTKRQFTNQKASSSPTFRILSKYIASAENQGFTQDPNIHLLESLPQITMEDIVKYYNENIAKQTMVYFVVGNLKEINKKELAKYGKVVDVSAKKIYR